MGSTVEAFAIHPGQVGTSLGGRGGSTVVGAAMKYGKRWMRTPAEGADTIVWLATESHVDTSEGIYFSDRKPSPMTAHARDGHEAAQLWSVSEELVSITLPRRYTPSSTR